MLDTATAQSAPGIDRIATARRHDLREALLLAAGGFILIFPLLLWLAGGVPTLTTLTTLATLDGGLRALGIALGLVATAAVVLMLWLTARVPLVEQTLGHDQALSWHARLGQWAVIGLVGHAVALLLGYAISEGAGLVSEFLSLWVEPDFVLAVIALGLFGLVSLTSIAAARRRLPYEGWQLIHLATYAAVLISLPHQFSMSGLFADGPAHWYWIGLFLVTFFVLLTYRVFLPIFLSLNQKLRVTRIDRVAPEVITITVWGPRIAELGTQAGQFFEWRFLAPGLWWHEHPFSVSAAPNNELRLTIKALGSGTRAIIDRLQVGTPVAIAGPYGRFTDAARRTPNVVLVGLGVGIAPIRSLLEATEFAPGHGTVILRCSDPEHVLLADEVAAWCAAKGAKLYVLPGHRGRNADGTASWLPISHEGLRLTDFAEVHNADVYVCGPSAVAELVRTEARRAGVPNENLHIEKFW